MSKQELLRGPFEYYGPRKTNVKDIIMPVIIMIVAAVCYILCAAAAFPPAEQLVARCESMGGKAGGGKCFVNGEEKP